MLQPHAWIHARLHACMRACAVVQVLNVKKAALLAGKVMKEWAQVQVEEALDKVRAGCLIRSDWGRQAGCAARQAALHEHAN